MEQPISRLLFYASGMIWFAANINQRSWQNNIQYSILEELKIMNKRYHSQSREDIDDKKKQLQ